MTEPRWLDEAEHRAWLGYRRMRLRLDAQIARDLAADSGLSLPDYDVLSALASAEDRRGRSTEIAARMLWSKSRLSRQLSRMERRGLVKRQECETDARGSDIVLTDQGLQAIRNAAPGHVDSVRAHFIDLLSEEQIAALGDMAETVLAHLGQVTTS
jgi:DNA-binding MarR family transcriptional regulator